jgi:Ferritin-like domain
MAPNRITRGGGAPPASLLTRGRAALALLAILALAGTLGGCGGGGGTNAATDTSAATDPAAVATTPAPENAEAAADAEVLEVILVRQNAAVGAYEAVIPELPPRLRAMAAMFRAQEQEHIDATTKAIRGLGGAVEAAAEEIETGELEDARQRLVFLYEVESVTIEDELVAVAKLEAATPRAMLAATVANQAQHLVLIRRALGARPLATIPAPFESGTQPAP